MGLHRAPCNINDNQIGSNASYERKRLFCALYVLDKQRVFLSGQPCDIYLFDSDLAILGCDSTEPANQCRFAHLHMMTLWEEIYINLYSPRSLRSSTNSRDSQVTRLNTLVQDWESHYEHLLSQSIEAEAAVATCLRAELRFSYHMALILIQRCHSKGIERKEEYTHARAVLKLLIGIALGPISTASFALLARYAYPIAFLIPQILLMNIS